MSEPRARPNDPFTPFGVGPEMALKVARLGFPGGGFRFCRKDKRRQKVTAEEISKWPGLKPPDCLVCGGRTVLLTPEEMERMVK